MGTLELFAEITRISGNCVYVNSPSLLAAIVSTECTLTFLAKCSGPIDRGPEEGPE